MSRVKNFTPEGNEHNLRANLDVIDKVRELARITGEAIKRRIERRYKTKVISRDFQKGDLILRKAHLAERGQTHIEVG